MGDLHQNVFIKKYADRFSGPFLEVGSKDYGNTQDIRSDFANKEKYIGVDMEDGPGVDVVSDLAIDFEEIDKNLGGMRFGTIFCLSVMEHCEQPFVMADNLSRLLKPGGKLCLSVPFSWNYHGYPSDYWRFTHEGVRKLFPKLDFDAEPGCSARSGSTEFLPLDENIGRISFSPKYYWRSGQVMRGISAMFLRMFSKVGVLSWLTGYNYVMAPTNVLMIGTRKAE